MAVVKSHHGISVKYSRYIGATDLSLINTQFCLELQICSMSTAIFTGSGCFQ